MNYHKYSADYVCPVSHAPIAQGVIVTDAVGTILDICNPGTHDPASVRHLPGLLVPGFINTHCHLELSHLQSVIPTGTGLIEFIKDIVTKRDRQREQILDAIAQADRQMLAEGIMAVGDISNTMDGLATKVRSDITYYSFVEMFDFMSAEWTPRAVAQYTPVYQDYLQAGQLVSAVPHAPYTVSDQLYQYIHTLNSPEATISIHNQETVHENQLFLTGEGDFPDFFRRFGVDFHSPVSGRTAIHHALERLDSQQRTLFVHNTQSNLHDIQTALAWNKRTYWATCANANLYIENRLPNYKNFLQAGAKLTIGTDSLASNWQLSVLAEMKTILCYNSWLTLEEVLKWATLHGAEALGLAHQLGSLQPGKKPGLIHLNTRAEDPFALGDGVTVSRVI